MRRVCLLLGAIAALAGSEARAAGLYIPDIGTRGMGRSGAFVAAPDDVLAIHYNPAGLSLIDGLQVEASVALVMMNGTFERTCPCLDPSLSTSAAGDARLEALFAQNPAEMNTVLAIPFVGVAYGLPFMDLTVALAAYGPNAGRHSWGDLPAASSPRFQDAAEAYPGRYVGIHMGTYEANFALGFGLLALPGLRVGGALYGFKAGSRQTLHLWTNSELLLDGDDPRGEDPALDTPVAVSFDEPFALNWGLGASYELLPGLSLGSSFRGLRSVRAAGKVDVQLPSKVADLVTVTGEDVEVELDFAPIWRTGLQFALPKVFRAEAAFVYETWSQHERILIRPRDVNISINGMEQALGNISVERHWKDTWSVRLGAELEVLEPLLSLRGGYFFETGAIPDEYLDPSQIDLPKHGFSLGAGLSMFGFELQVAGQLITMASRQVTTSVRQIVGPLDGAQEYLTTVANGRYGGTFFVISSSLKFEFDPLLGAD